MANPPLDLHCDQPDPTWHPQTFGEACAFIDQLLRGSIEGAYTPFVTGETTPAVADQDKLWFKTAGGRPLGFYGYYGGVWRRAYTGIFNEVRMFTGNPSFFFGPTGEGITGGEWDGWHLCNGLDGTIDMTDKFVVAAHLNGTSGISMYSGGWRTGVTGAEGAGGGQKEVTLTPAQIPTAPTSAITLYKWSADGNVPAGGGDLYGVFNSSAGTSTIIPADAGNPDPDPVRTLPPYIVMGFVVFRGYP